MRILITGGSGFIGKHLIKALVGRHQIYALYKDNKIEGRELKAISADLVGDNFEASLPQNIDCVIHLAQSSNYRDFPESAVDIYEVNVEATFRLLEWCRKNKVQRFIFTSTANVYSQTSGLLDESSPTIPDSFYGATKLSAENMMRQYQKFFDIDILRLFTVYGENQKEMLFPNLVERIKTGTEITLAQGYGVHLTPIHIDDVVGVINALVNSQPQGKISIFNVCGGESISLDEIVRKLEVALSISALVRHTDDPESFFLGSNYKLRTSYPDLDFTSLKSGLRKTFA